MQKNDSFRQIIKILHVFDVIICEIFKNVIDFFTGLLIDFNCKKLLNLL